MKELDMKHGISTLAGLNTVLEGAERAAVTEAWDDNVASDHFQDGKLPRDLAAILRKDGAIAVNQAQIEDLGDGNVLVTLKRGTSIAAPTFVRIWKKYKMDFIGVSADPTGHPTLKFAKTAL